MPTESVPTMPADALMPPDMARRAEEAGVRKASMDPLRMFVLAVLAGAFIALGGLFSTTVAIGSTGVLPFGIVRLVMGIAFSLGLILVCVGGAELFTGNNLIVMAWAGGRVRTAQVIRNWALVFAGNFAGALATALLVYLARWHDTAGGAAGLMALQIGQAKASLDFVPALTRGILCNALVCLAVWLTYSARSTTDRVLVIVPAISAFVATGMEHSIANLYFLPLALMIRAWSPSTFWDSISQTPDAFAALTSAQSLTGNLIPVTLGNIIGGAAMVGLVYWFVYLRRSGEKA